MTEGTSSVPIVHLLLPTGARVTYDITKKTTVSDIIARLSEDPSVTHPPDRTITLLYRGRILKPNRKIARLDSLDEFTVQVFYRAPRHREEAQPEAPLPSDLRGFDRLRRMNVPDSYIEQVRREFHEMNGTQNATAEERLALEEEWFPVIFDPENPMSPLTLPLTRRQQRRQRRESDEEELEFGNGDGIRLSAGLALGLLFGVGSLVFVVVAIRDRWFLIGLFAGACAHYVVRFALGLSVV